MAALLLALLKVIASFRRASCADCFCSSFEGLWQPGRLIAKHQHVSFDRYSPERQAYPPLDDRPTVEETGTVKWYNPMKGFGFIGLDVFVHATALERSGLTGLAEGQRVTVDVADGRKGPEAISLRLI